MPGESLLLGFEASCKLQICRIFVGKRVLHKAPFPSCAEANFKLIIKVVGVCESSERSVFSQVSIQGFPSRRSNEALERILVRRPMQFVMLIVCGSAKPCRQDGVFIASTCTLNVPMCTHCTSFEGPSGELDASVATLAKDIHRFNSVEFTCTFKVTNT